MKKKYVAVAGLSAIFSTLIITTSNATPTYDNGFYYTFEKGHSTLFVDCDSIPDGVNWNTALQVSPSVVGQIKVIGTCGVASENAGLKYVNYFGTQDSIAFPGTVSDGSTVIPLDNNWHNVPSVITVSQSELSQITITSHGNRSLTIVGVPVHDSSDTPDPWSYVQSDAGAINSWTLADPVGQSKQLTKTLSIPATNVKILQSSFSQLGDKGGCDLAGDLLSPHPYATLKIKVKEAGDFTFRAVEKTPANSNRLHRSLSNQAAINQAVLAVYNNFDSTQPDVGVNGCNRNGFEDLASPGIFATSDGYLVPETNANFTSHLDVGTYTLVLITYRAYTAEDWGTELTNNSDGVSESVKFQLWGNGQLEEDLPPAPPVPPADPATTTATVAKTGGNMNELALAGVLVMAGFGAIQIARRKSAA